MTTNQTIDGVPRELLERLLIAVTQDFATIGEVRELRALLDADKVNNRQMGLMEFVEAHPIKPAAQPQGKPVAIVDEGDDGLFIEFIYGENGNPLQRGNKLYASPPAPVAVTLSQVLTAYDYAEAHPHKYLRGTTNWCAAVVHKLNACLDEATRLNTKE